MSLAPPSLTLHNADFGSLIGPLWQTQLVDLAEIHAADRLGHCAGERDPEVLLACALALRAPRLGHTGVDLAHVTDDLKRDWQAAHERLLRSGAGQADQLVAPRWPTETRDWVSRTRQSALTASSTDEGRPLVWHDGLLQSHRMAACEVALASQLLARQQLIRLAPQQHDRAAEHLRRLLGDSRDTDPQQAIAAALAMLAQTTIICGGPGTGKTTTIRKVLLALRQTMAPEQPMRVALTAPTGKAAARMREALQQQPWGTITAEEQAWLATLQAVTLHKLLGRQTDSPTRPRYHRDRTLPADVVVVDEASMADITLMRQLFDAASSHTRLILLGDPHQLASVEAGSVLSDLTQVPSQWQAGADADTLRAIGALLGPAWPLPAPSAASHPLARSIVRFARAFRFKNSILRDAIGEIAAASEAPTAVQSEQHVQRAESALLHSGSDTVRHVLHDGVAGEQLASTVLEEVAVRYAWVLAPLAGQARPQSDELPADLRGQPAAEVVDPLATDAAALAVLDALDGLRVLSGHRDGPLGVSGLNARITAAIQQRLATPPGLAGTPWWPGRVVLVTENDYEKGLWNGDLGIVVGRDSGPLVLFRAADGVTVRYVAASTMPAHETAFAMTIHKSQGSQFGHVFLVLPQRASRLMTRELVYTGISRAKTHLTICGSAAELQRALRVRVERATGLAGRVWQQDSSATTTGGIAHLP